VKGFDVGQPAVCPGMDARKPLTAVLECSAYLSALNTAPFHGGDDFAGSARQRTASSALQPADPRPGTAVPGSLLPTGGSWLATDRLGGKNVAAW
jgi:hypothetical protein